MAEVNGTDHLVRHEKETKLNGYDNDGFHSQERSEEEEESASDDDRLRVVVTENGHRPEDDSHLSNGHLREEPNGYTTTVNGCAVIVVEDSKGNSNMSDKEDTSQKPLDTRLHHYVPVEDIDRKILNGSDGTHVTIPEDAVINFTTGRVKVKRGASNNSSGTNDRESIPLETMLPTYEEDKIGLGGGEKAELEAELGNHKNGLWSEGHNAYSNPEAPFGNSEKLNGTSKSSEGVSPPVNNHRKCLSSDVSDTSSEQKSTGEKLYFTEESSRKLCPGWRRIFVCGLILIILAVALLLGVLAATGILLAESEGKSTRYESGHSQAPSYDSISHAGHPLTRPKVPHKFLPPPVTTAGNAVSRSPLATVTSKVPDDASHSQTIVPNALVGEFSIDENFTDDLKDNSSEGYQSLAKYIERELQGIFRRNGGKFEELKILNFSPGSIKIKFVTVWSSDRHVILSQKAVEMMKSHLRKNHNSLLAYPVNLNSIHFIDVFDECRIQTGGCSFKCIWDYDRLAKRCICQENMVLLADGKSCGPKTSTRILETTTLKFIYSSLIPTSTVTEPTMIQIPPKTTLEQPDKTYQTTTQIPTVITKAVAAISEIFKQLTTTESTTSEETITSILQNISIINELSSTELTTQTDVPTVATEINFSSENHEEIGETTSTETTMSDSILLGNENSTTENVNFFGNLSLDITASNLGDETTTFNSHVLNESNPTESDTIIPDLLGMQNDSTLSTSASTESMQEDNFTIGYHIIEETTELYTFEHDTENSFGNETVTTQELNNSTAELSVTSSETTVQPDTNKTSTPEFMTKFLLTTETFTTESFMDSTKAEVIEKHTTEMPDFYLTNATANEDNLNFTTIKTMEENSTHTVGLKDRINSTPSEMLMNEYNKLNITDIPSEVAKEDETTSSSVTTTFTLPSLFFQQTNRTPEVRSFDDDVQNDTFIASTDSVNIDGVIHKASTEINAYADNSSTTEFNVLTSSPYTTATPTVELFFDTTLLSNITGDSAGLETTTDTNSKSFNDSQPIESKEKSEANTTLASGDSDFSVENIEVLVHTEATLKNSSSIDIINDMLNDTLGTTIFTDETQITTIQPTENGSYNESYGLTEITMASLNENVGIENSTEMNTTLIFSDVPVKTVASENESTISPEMQNNTNINTFPPSDETSLINTFENGTTNIQNTTESITIVPSDGSMQMTASDNATTVAPDSIEMNITFISSDMTTLMTYSEDSTTMAPNLIEITENPTIVEETTRLFNDSSINNETEVVEPFETALTNIENNNGTTIADNFFDAEVLNTSLELNYTENPLINNTSEFLNIPNDERTFGNDTVTSTFETDDLNVSNTNSSEDNVGNETLIIPSDSRIFNNSTENITLTTIEDFSFPTPPTNISEYTTAEPKTDVGMLTTIEYSNDTLMADDFDSNFTSLLDGELATLLPEMNETMENSTFFDFFGNSTTGYEDVTNETTTNATTGIECREDQFLCESLNICINNTFMCDGIEDCPDAQDEFECKDTCHSNFMCGNSSNCIMNEARCDGIWDCENGTDEENCTPTECAKHEVMCLDGSKCIKPGYICDLKYDCLDRSDEVGCVERTTCESGGRFFCNDGLCIPWSLKCDGEHDCKDGEDEGNCTCLNDEFQCNDGKCLKSSSRCDGHQDCHDADDEMGCVNVDSQHILSTYEPYSGTWGLLCAEDWNQDDGQHLCQELGFGHALNVERVHVSFNGTWMAMRRENLTEASLWTERVSFVESCTSGLAAAVECQKFACGEYPGLLHRRRRDVISSSSSQWPFIGYTSTFHSNKGCLSEILTPIWLITSAECLLSMSKEPFNGSDWYVRTNIGRNTEIDVAQNHEVLKIITHPHSSKFRSLTLRDYDVAMIRLKHALVFVSDKIGAICPPDEQVPPGITCFSGVLGTEKPRAPPPQILTINSLALQLIDRRNCNRIEHYNNTINQRMLCTQSSEGHTICDNDEGTPLMCLSGINNWFLAGMLTYQRFCDVYSKHPAVFSNLFSMRKFLDQVTGQKQYEIPYDNSIYSIIPPTTPSPTLPEITTIETTTDVTTELTTSIDTTYRSTLEFENSTGSGYDILAEINGTTVPYEELAREENDTVTHPGEFEIALTNVTDHILNENETATVLPYGMGFDVINTTTDQLTKSDDEFSTNRTHSYFMSLSNDTSTSDGINVTDTSTTDFANKTLPDVPQTSTIALDLTNITMDAEIQDISSMSELAKPDEVETNTTISTDLIDTLMNETESPLMGMATVENVTYPIDDFHLSNPNYTFLNVSEDTVTDLPPVNTFNESIKIFEPVLSQTNDSKSISQPLISLQNDTTDDTDKGDLARLLTTETSDYRTENGVLKSTFNEEIPKPMTGLTNISVSEALIFFTNDTTATEKANLTALPILETSENNTENIHTIIIPNETSEMLQPIIELTNRSLSEPLISLTNDTAQTEKGNRTTLPVLETSENHTENMPLIGIFNETIEMLQPMIQLTNASLLMSQPLALLINDTAEMKKNYTGIESETLHTLEITENSTENMPLFRSFNESIEMFKPEIESVNESKPISQPLTSSLSNDTAEMKKGSFRTLELSRDYAENTNTESSLLENSSIRNDKDITLETAITPIEAKSVLEMTAQPILHDTDTITFEVEDEPQDDLAFSIFKNSDGLQLESLSEKNMDNMYSRDFMPGIGISEDTNMATMETEKHLNATAIEVEKVTNITTIDVEKDTNITAKEAEKYTNITEVELGENTNITDIENERDINKTASDAHRNTERTTIEAEREIENSTFEALFDVEMTNIGEQGINMTTIGDANITSTEGQDTSTTTTEDQDSNITATEDQDSSITTTEEQDTVITNTEDQDSNIASTEDQDSNITTTEDQNSNITATKDQDIFIITTEEQQENTNRTMYSPFVLPNPIITALPLSTITVYPDKAFNRSNLDFEFNKTIEDTNAEFKSSHSNYTANYTTLVSNEMTSDSENISLSNSKQYEDSTEVPSIEINSGIVEDPSIKMHLISEGLTVLQDNTSLILNECGDWKNSSAVIDGSREDFFNKWPALGYLQMVSEPKMCPSTVVSSKFVITSLNCLTLRDTDLNPDKWTYIDGSQISNTTSSGIEKYEIEKIIPYPDKSTSLFLIEHDVALVRVKELIRMNDYSKSACLGNNLTLEKECFTVGWDKNSTDDEQQKFISIPTSIISPEECNATIHYTGKLMDHLICGKHDNETVNACQMDFGSPLFCLNDYKQWEIHGILNLPGPCDKAQPAVFSSIPNVKKWILDTLTKSSEKLLN